MDNDDLVDIFAGMAMQGLLASAREVPAEICAKAAYDLAEAMVKEKEKRLARKKVRSAQGN